MNNKILVIGSSNTDMTIKGKKLPAPGETVTGGVFYMGPGGKGANQAVAAKRLGGDVEFICKVGNDRHLPCHALQRSFGDSPDIGGRQR